MTHRNWVSGASLVLAWVAAAVTLTILDPAAPYDLTSLARPPGCPDVIVASCADISGPFMKLPLGGSLEVAAIARASVVGSWLLEVAPG